MSDSGKPDAALSERLARLESALAPRASASRVVLGAPSAAPLKVGGKGAMALAVALLAVGVATGHLALLGPATLLLILGGLLQFDRLGEIALHNLPAGTVASDPLRARIGMGASVASDAVVEPGATVEMGASVSAGAIIRRGAVVRMGASVGAGAILEANAVVSWGASVKKNAVVGAGASVGAGANVGAGAQLPPGMMLQPGVDWQGRGTEAIVVREAGALSAPVANLSSSVPVDPRQARIEAACQTLDAQLAAAPEAFREMLGDPTRTVRTLRQTALALLGREATLRRESGPDRLTYLDAERSGLSRRLEAESDGAIQKSLRGAVAAIDDQLQQRRALARHADRLDAEVTRLVFTLEGMGAQLVRLQSAGTDAAAPGDAMGASLQSLHDEVEAIVSALEEMAQPESAAEGPSAVVEVGDAPAAGRRDRDRA